MWRRSLLWYGALVMANGALLVAIINLWRGTPGSPPAVRLSLGAKEAAGGLRREPEPLSAYQVIAARNLFSPERTGPDLGHGRGRGQDRLEGGRLLGVVLMGEEKVALIGYTAPQGPPQVQALRVGERLGEYQVMEITSESVIFQGKEDRRQLQFPQ